MIINKMSFKLIQILLMIFILTSCGGGSGGESPPQSESTDNNNFINETCTNTSRLGMERCVLKHDNIERYYYLYIPNSIDFNESTPVLFAFHGYGSSAERHLNYTNYFRLADSNNFIVIYPQGASTSTLSSHWNVGGWTSSSPINDVGFIEVIINLLQNKIQIDQSRIYSSGMSNGGYFGYHLACNLSDRFAAVASITGSMTNNTFDDCSPTHPMPILQIHGLLDYIVPYEGNYGSKSISEVIEYWVNYNSCNLYPDTLIRYDDYSLITFDTYFECLNEINVKLILHPTMGHTWPSIQSHNIDASSEIWEFVSKYDLYGLIK